MQAGREGATTSRAPALPQPELAAKRQKFDDDGSNYWNALPLKEKIKAYDQLDLDVAAAKNTKGLSVEDAISASAMPQSTYYRWRKRGFAETIRAAINDVPSFGHFHEAREIPDLTKYLPRDDDEELSMPEEEEAELCELQQEQEAKDNAALMLRALKHHVPLKSTVMDGTNGEGVFLSHPETKASYICLFADKFKNEVQNADKYEGVLSYECVEFKSYVSRRNVVMVFIWDPPYRTISGGHTILNCTFTKSVSRIRFNRAYGVEYRYTNDMINAIYLRGFYWADQVLHANGFFFVKCMQLNDNFDQLQSVKDMADLYNFCVKEVYTLKSVCSTRDDSYLLVMKRKRSTFGKTSQTKAIKSLRDLTFSPEEANKYRQDMKRRINAKAAEAYKEAIETSLENGRLWSDACCKMLTGLTEQQRFNAFKDIQEDIIDSFKSFQTKNAEIRQQLDSNNDTYDDWRWERFQTLALSAQSIFLDIKNICGLVFEQHLIQAGVCIEDRDSLATKKMLLKRLVGGNNKIKLVNKKSHTSLSRNINFLRSQRNEDEQCQNNPEHRLDEEEEKVAEEDTLKQTSINQYFKKNGN